MFQAAVVSLLRPDLSASLTARGLQLREAICTWRLTQHPLTNRASASAARASALLRAALQQHSPLVNLIHSKHNTLSPTLQGLGERLARLGLFEGGAAAAGLVVGYGNSIIDQLPKEGEAV